MITVIHGDDINQSRISLSKLRSSLSNATVLDGSEITKESILDYFSSNNLFGDKKNLIIENLLSKNRPSKRLSEIIDTLSKNQKETHIILWEGKEIGTKTISQFHGAEVMLFKIPKIIFDFLDNIRPGNGNKLVHLFNELSQNSPMEIILFMLIRQFRIMLSFSSMAMPDLEEVSRMAPWQKGKIQNQAHLFSTEALKKNFQTLFEIDLFSKTGRLNKPLSSAIDIFLLSI